MTTPVGAARLGTAVTATVVGSAAVVSVVLPRVLEDSGSAQAASLPAWFLVTIAVSVAVVVAAIWLSAAAARGTSVGLALALLAAVAPLLAGEPWLPDRLRVAALSAAPLTVAALAGVAGHVRWRVPVVGLAAGATVVLLLGYDPFEHPACRQICAEVPSVLAPVAGTRTAVLAAACLTVAAAAVVAALARRSAVRVGVRLAVVILAATVILRWFAFDRAGGGSVNLPLEVVVVGVVGAVVCFVRIRLLQLRAEIAALVAGMRPETFIGGAVVAVQFAFPGEDRWLDPAGAEVDGGPPTERCVLLTDSSGPVARLVLGRRINPVDVAAGLSPATRLALRNAQLSAVALARQVQVRASRRRVVSASDAERRRIERDLHDGAQQRLIGAALQLRVASSELQAAGSPDGGPDGMDAVGNKVATTDRDATAARIARAEGNVLDSLARLRRLAHGLFPSVLEDEGLGAALEELVMASDVPATLDVSVDRELPLETATAAYATVAAVLGSVGAPTATTHCAIAVRLEDGRLIARATLEPGGAVVRRADLTALEDRIGASEGELVVSQDGRQLEAVMPCESS
ncbi:histidine kinase [Kribbella sp. NPDC049584]|uniref:sensor histidine kinase n=1 Tax=Kribbella sp. NPDC049584 TaxID=3154833 RepID=UPI00342CBFF6